MDMITFEKGLESRFKAGRDEKGILNAKKKFFFPVSSSSSCLSTFEKFSSCYQYQLQFKLLEIFVSSLILSWRVLIDLINKVSLQLCCEIVCNIDCSRGNKRNFGEFL